jgi:comEA protein
MNRKEMIVLFFLCFTFLIGIGVKFIRRHKEQRNLQAITIKKIINDTLVTTIDEEEVDSIDVTTLININKASNKELEALSGIGPALAQRIIEYRQKYGGFKTKDEIKRVSGIGPKKFAAIEDKITTIP